MTVELTQEVSDRLSSDNYGWLTTVAKSGQPVPRLVWFYSDGNGAGIIVVGGNAAVDAEGIDPLGDKQYRAKYGELAATFGFSEEFLAAYSTRLKISIDKVWTTPTEG
jgi:hypothetical protein